MKRNKNLDKTKIILLLPQKKGWKLIQPFYF